jgi:hypothetical protein
MPEHPSCDTPPELTSLGQPLPRLAEALRDSGDISIAAIGSSSTFGEGASPGNGYVDKLATALSDRFPGRKINMHNAGVNGDEALSSGASFGNILGGALKARGKGEKADKTEKAKWSF